MFNGGYKARDIAILIVFGLGGAIAIFCIVGCLTKPRDKYDRA